MRVTLLLASFLSFSSSAMAEEEKAASPMVEAKQAVKSGAQTVGHATRDTAKAIGHGTRDAAKAVGHGSRDAVKGVGNAAKKAWKELKGPGEVGAQKE